MSLSSRGTGRTRSYRMNSYARGQDDAAVLYLEPAREKGTKMLRKDDSLWLYMPGRAGAEDLGPHAAPGHDGLVWIYKESMMPLRQELFALSGMMLKTWIMSEIERVSGRPVARRMEISDQLKEDSRTAFSLEEVSFGVELESEIFTRRWLERK